MNSPTPSIETMVATLQPDPVAARRWSRRREEIAQDGLRAAPRLSLSEWADEYVRLPSEFPEPGPWRTSRTPYLREIMDAVSDPEIETVAFMKGSQLGWTVGVIVNAIGYSMHQDPHPILVFQPALDDARKFSLEKLAPVLNETRVLARKLTDRSRDSANTILDKKFDGGWLGIASAGSPRALRQRSAPWVIFDEVDGYDLSSGGEGGPIKLGRKRTTAYSRRQRKIIMGSTPTEQGYSHIEKAYQNSDRRRHHLPCPHCDHGQVLRWGDKGADFGFKWDADDPGSVAYLCEHCHALIEERWKTWMLEQGVWVPEKPGREVAGFHLPQWYSPFDGARWPILVREFLESKDEPEDRRVWVNHVAAQTFKETVDEIDVSEIQERAEEHTNADGLVVDVPDGVGVLTAAVDVQATWMEVLVRGWGIGEESWDILHHRIMVGPELSEGWAVLEGILTRPYIHVRGGQLRTLSTMIDAGYQAPHVYEFVKPRQGRGVHAILGDRTGDRSHEDLKRPTKANSDGVMVYTVGTFRMKDRLFRRLGIDVPGPGYIHVRKHNPERCNGFDDQYFEGLEAEEKRRVRGNLRYVKKSRDARNEPIDLHVYNQAAFLALGVEVRGNMQAWVEAARQPPEEAKPRSPKKRKGQGSSWATGWK